MLLINFKSCNIDNKCEKDKKVNNAINRNKRENNIDNFNLKVISIYNIDFFDIKSKENNIFVDVIVENINVTNEVIKEF